MEYLPQFQLIKAILISKFKNYSRFWDHVLYTPDSNKPTISSLLYIYIIIIIIIIIIP